MFLAYGFQLRSLNVLYFSLCGSVMNRMCGMVSSHCNGEKNPAGLEPFPWTFMIEISVEMQKKNEVEPTNKGTKFLK